MLTCHADTRELARLAADLRARAAHPVPVDARHQAGSMVAAVWEASSHGVPLPGLVRPIHHPVTATVTTTETGVVIAIPPDDARAVEGGTRAWDMKPGLTHGPKSRVGRHGSRYTIIPFQHRAADVPSAAVWALLFNARYVDPHRQTSANAPAVLGSYTWRTGQFSGIRLGRTGPVTFRTVSTRSPAASWWYPARPGQPWADPVWAYVADAVTSVWVRAWEEAVFGGDERGGTLDR